RGDHRGGTAPWRGRIRLPVQDRRSRKLLSAWPSPLFDDPRGVNRHLTQNRKLWGVTGVPAWRPARKWQFGLLASLTPSVTGQAAVWRLAFHQELSFKLSGSSVA